MIYRHHILYTDPQLDRKFVVYDKWHMSGEDQVDVFTLPKIVNHDRIVYHKVNVFTGKKEAMTRTYVIAVGREGGSIVLK